MTHQPAPPMPAMHDPHKAPLHSSAPQPNVAQRVKQVVDFYTQLQPNRLPELHHWYAPTARFKDPFHAVQGPAAIEAIFRHMYASLQEPHFVVTQQVLEGAQCFLIWDFHFRLRRFDTRTLHTIHGTSHLVFNAQGQIELHRDYWDSAEELYEKIPGLGGFMRWLKTRARA